MLRSALERAWYRPTLGWVRLLLPLSRLYGAAVALRRAAYRRGWLSSVKPRAPVVVVGNITVGGTGKTPLVAALAIRLAERGRRPGIVSRGYGGDRVGNEPILVKPDSDPAEVGDEPVLLARRVGCPVAVCRRRAAAARYLVESHGVDVIVADDGLQHYALARDAEIAVRDDRRGYGNGCLLPAGPLREPVARLREADLELVQGEQADFSLEVQAARPVAGFPGRRPLREFADAPVHAVAGIGHPERFFDLLRAHGLEVVEHAYPDHYRYRPRDIDYQRAARVLMTEKDAVKCAAFSDHRHWYLPVAARLSDTARASVDALFDRLLGVAA